MTIQWWEVLQETVRLEGLERLDLVDARAMQNIQVSQSMEMLGALMGKSSGALSAPTGVLRQNGGQWFLDIGPFQFFMSFENRSSDGAPIRSKGFAENTYGEDRIKSRRGVVLSHDPKDPWQTSTVNVTSLLSIVQSNYDTNGSQLVWDDAIFPYLFVRPRVVDTESDLRQFWDTTSGQEVSSTIATRKRVAMDFYLGVVAPAIENDTPYVKVARVLRWFPDVNFSGGDPKPEIPILYPISVWDSDESARFVKHPGDPSFDGPIDGLVNPLGVAPTSVQVAQSSQFGQAPVSAGSNASDFMAPFPDYTDQHGFNWGGNITNRSAEQPEMFGLVPLLRVMRDRISGLLSTDKIVPWWRRPEKGLAELVSADTALSQDISTNANGITVLQEQLAALQTQVDAIPTQFGVVVARGHVKYNEVGTPQWQVQGNARNIVSVITGNNRFVNVVFPSVVDLGGFRIEEVFVQPWTPDANLTPETNTPLVYEQNVYPGNDDWEDDDNSDLSNFDGSTNIWRVWTTSIGQNASNQVATVFMEGLEFDFDHPDGPTTVPRTVWGSFQIIAIGRKVSAV